MKWKRKHLKQRVTLSWKREASIQKSTDNIVAYLHHAQKAPQVPHEQKRLNPIVYLFSKTVPLATKFLIVE